ncbi:hypothetical protein [Brevibacillus sp. HD3.3A]|uniref:hypothetical protein n=1 Tax=Brevibacillus sp. HD3.3A TaxID=2738979 RepID=UPI00156B85D5|nr:hypothetical protein [Brevibacillus sp. HD3.3A]UED70760.1 hypothetical protein HP435_09015 [Brevibacillus sp. HD3.3A]
MKVQIEGNLYLESDDMQFIIKEYNGKKDATGRELYKTHGYFPSVQSAVKHLVKMKVMQSTAQTLSELHQDALRIEQYVESQLTV